MSPLLSSPASPQPIKIGDIIANKYKVLASLGKGGMGKVFKVSNTHSHESYSVYALKAVTDKTDNDLELLKIYFDKEPLIMANLPLHDHLPKVYERGEDKDKKLRYFIMEYIEGESLENLLKSPLPIHRALEIAIQVSKALEFIHSQQPQIVHRDIKPKNIMIESKTDRVVVVDFGVAKRLDLDSIITNTAITIEGYEAPEQKDRDYFKNKEVGAHIDGRADIYSLGRVLYAMLTGHPSPPPQSQKWKNIPPCLQELMLKATAENPDQRYNTAKELIEALNKVLQEVLRPALSTTPVKIQVAKQDRKRRKKALWISGALGVLATLMVMIARIGEWPWRDQFTDWIKGLVPEEPTKPAGPQTDLSPSEAPQPKSALTQPTQHEPAQIKLRPTSISEAEPTTTEPPFIPPAQSSDRELFSRFAELTKLTNFDQEDSLQNLIALGERLPQTVRMWPEAEEPLRVEKAAKEKLEASDNAIASLKPALEAWERERWQAETTVRNAIQKITPFDLRRKGADQSSYEQLQQALTVLDGRAHGIKLEDKKLYPLYITVRGRDGGHDTKKLSQEFTRAMEDAHFNLVKNENEAFLRVVFRVTLDSEEKSILPFCTPLPCGINCTASCKAITMVEWIPQGPKLLNDCLIENKAVDDYEHHLIKARKEFVDMLWKEIINGSRLPRHCNG